MNTQRRRKNELKWNEIKVYCAENKVLIVHNTTTLGIQTDRQTATNTRVHSSHTLSLNNERIVIHLIRACAIKQSQGFQPQRVIYNDTIFSNQPREEFNFICIITIVNTQTHTQRYIRTVIPVHPYYSETQTDFGTTCTCVLSARLCLPVHQHYFNKRNQQWDAIHFDKS